MQQAQQIRESFSCLYAREGCKSTALMTAGHLASHVVSCPYRPLECRMYLNSDTGKLCGHNETGQVPFGTYGDHLFNHHSQIYNIDHEDGWYINEYCVEENIKDEAPDPSWDPVTFDYDGMTFLLVQSLWDDKLFWRVFIIGTEDDAKKYKGYIDVCSSEHVPTPETVELGKLEILPIRKYSTDLIWLGSRDTNFKRTYLSLILDKVEEKFKVDKGVLEDDPSFLWKVHLFMEKHRQ